eukprot:gnl/MRDRNA2_/MRDRNA2_35840_c0_seq1.p1 gnl/MRDRNA2_/MRDRNA2_35840_c0~~gnl/MRDRNA2_/MRDRNA2_35840_c0_seq1.p1  ORF type:complete len:123 (+),score=26.64 gnl/MRDRNA2_/MRDRNA2_35840_c0_seq1:114-482(+)
MLPRCKKSVDETLPLEQFFWELQTFQPGELDCMATDTADDFDRWVRDRVHDTDWSEDDDWVTLRLQELESVVWRCYPTLSNPGERIDRIERALKRLRQYRPKGATTGSCDFFQRFTVMAMSC